MPTAITHAPPFTVPGSSTSTALVRWNGTGGNQIQDSTILVGATTMGLAADTDLVTFSNGTLTIAGTVAATTLTGAGAGITALAAANITASGTLPALNGAALTALNGTQVTSGTLPAARIADDSIVEAKLDVSNGPTNGQFLQAQSGEGGGLTWAAAGGTTYTTGSTNVHAVNDATTGVTLNNNYKFTMVMPSSGEGFFFKCADQGSEQSALFYADYPSQITKIAGSSKWEVLDGGQTGSSSDGKYYVVSDANSRTITVFNREGNNRTITVHGMGRLASVTAQASI